MGTASIYAHTYIHTYMSTLLHSLFAAVAIIHVVALVGPKAFGFFFFFFQPGCAGASGMQRIKIYVVVIVS